MTEEDFLVAVETHDVAALAGWGASHDGEALVRGRRPVDWLLGVQTRSSRFGGCLEALLAPGGRVLPAWLTPVLLDDMEGVRRAADRTPFVLTRLVALDGAHTSLAGVTALHVAVEYGAWGAASALMAAGADVNARAAVDAQGLGGQTPLFHAVNTPDPRALRWVRGLLGAGASPSLRVDGVRWGVDRVWETVLFDATPVSYAQAGLLPQMGRDEGAVYNVVASLLRAAGRSVPVLNVPNQYVAGPPASRA